MAEPAPRRTAPALPLLTTAGTLELGGRPWLMGVVNATPDSFSEAGGNRTLDERVELARSLLAAGADIIDVGGESGVTNQPPVAPEEEIERVVPLIERVTRELRAVVSVDTYKPAVAHAAIGAGAAIVNDVSGLRDPELADVCAGTGAALVLMHTRAAPKEKLLDPTLDGLVGADVKRFLRERMSVAMAHGVAFEQLMLDPGPDFGKTPAQTVEVLRELSELHDLERPLLLAVSRKYFIGMLTDTLPEDRLAGTIAALEFGVSHGARIVRVHDVAQVAQYLRLRAALHGDGPVAMRGSRDDERLKWIAPKAP